MSSAVDVATGFGEGLGGMAVLVAGGAAVSKGFRAWLRRRFVRYQRDEKLDLILARLVPNGGSSVLDAVVRTHDEVLALRRDVQEEWASSIAVHQELQRQLDELHKARTG